MSRGKKNLSQPLTAGVGPQGSTMLKATQEGLFSWKFSVSDEKGRVIDVWIPLARHKAVFNIGRKEYEVRTRREHGRWFKYAFILKSDDELIAEAEAKGSYYRDYTIFYSGHSFELTAPHFYKFCPNTFYLLENNRQVGRIIVTKLRFGLRSILGLSTPNALIDLPDELPIPVQLFLFSLVVFSWRVTGPPDA